MKAKKVFRPLHLPIFLLCPLFPIPILVSIREPSSRQMSVVGFHPSPAAAFTPSSVWIFPFPQLEFPSRPLGGGLGQE